jgi:hypothetical protein
MFLGISIAAAFPLAWYFLRNDHDADANPVKQTRRSPAKVEEPKPARRRNFKGASIQPGDQCCQAVREISTTRFLVEEAPRLPLERCDRIGECLCKYNNYPDRRSGDDRRDLFGSLSTSGEIGTDISNVRSGMERRSSSEDEFEGIEFETDLESH